MAEPVLDIANLVVTFETRGGTIPAVTDFSCRIMPGEAMGLVGESGCGKSTVALAIMRYLGSSGRIAGGTIRFAGRDMAELTGRELRALRGAGIAMIYQEPMASLNPAMTVARQLMEVPIRHAGAGRADALAQARAMVAAVGLPDPGRILRAFPHQLSGGQQQRIVIAMALMAKPALLILDEPTTALDVTVEAGIVDLVKGLCRSAGTALLFISHNLGLVREVCDRVCVMYAGEAVEVGDVAEVFGRMRHPYTRALFRSIPRLDADRVARPLVPIPGTLPLPQERPTGCRFGPRCDAFVSGRCDIAAIPMMPLDRPGHASRCVRVGEIDWQAAPVIAEGGPPPAIGAPVLRVSALKKYYQLARLSLFGRRPAWFVKANESLSFEAREAETVAIVGESGCGKSTLAKVLVGLETASSGEATLDGKPIGGVPVRRRDRKTVASIQMIFQNPFDTLNPSVRVGDQLVRALEKFGVGRTRAERRARMLALLDMVRLPRSFAARVPRQLSGGQKQRVGIARAFAGTPRLVVADEPVSALDVSVQAAVTELLADIQRRSATSLLFISHDLSIVRYLADRVVVMYLGHIVEQGTTADVFAPPYHPYTEALLSAVPVADPSVRRERIVLQGELPSAIDPPPGCPFQTRCRWKAHVPDRRCETVLPDAIEVAPGHRIRCHLPPSILASMRPVTTRVDA